MHTFASHVSWRDETINQSLDKSFGSLGPSCKTVIGKIINQLSEISLQAGEFGISEDKEQKNPNPDDARWKLTLKSKIKFALISDASLQKNLEALRKSNETFITLSSQVRQLSKQWPQERKLRTQGVRTCKTKLRRIQVQRLTSIDLYQTLLQTRCTKHQHFLRLNLHGMNNEPEEQQNDDSFRFNICYCTELPNDYRQNLSAKFNQFSSPMNDAAEVQVTVRSKLENPVPESPGQPEITEPGATRQLERSEPNMKSQMSSIADATSLCQELTSVKATQEVPANQNLRELTEDGRFAKHSMEIQGAQFHLKRRCLSKILTRDSSMSSSIREVPIHARLAIAKCIGGSVLPLYATPWLSDNLNSNEIYIDDKMLGTAKAADLNKLYVNVHLSESHDSIYDTLESHQPPSLTTTALSSRFGIQIRPRNSWLYHLGILLIELAYHAHFADLMTEVETEYMTNAIPLPADDECAEFQIACHLADNVGTILGASYAEVVRKCIRCDFGLGGITDLGDLNLQEQVYESVVNRLTLLERGYRKLTTFLNE